MLYTDEKIKGLLPHRAPFLFANDVNVVEMGVRGTARLAKADIKPYWTQQIGLAPAQSWDVILLETVAQVFGVVLASGVQGKNMAEGKHLLLGFDNVEFAMILDEAEFVDLDVKVSAIFGSMYKGVFSVSQNGTHLGSGELTVMQGDMQ